LTATGDFDDRPRTRRAILDRARSLVLFGPGWPRDYDVKIWWHETVGGLLIPF